MPSLSKFTSIAPQMQLFDLPFLFKIKTIYKVMDGEVGATLKSKLMQKTNDCYGLLGCWI